MAKPMRELTHVIEETVRERLPGNWEKYSSRHLVDEGEIRQARRLATMSFVALDKIDADEVNADGILKNDSLLELSNFFATFNRQNEVQSAARLIWSPDVTISDLRLPTDRIDSDKATELESAGAGKIAEIGSLAKRPGAPTVTTLKMLRELWTFADDNGVEKFVCGLEPKLYPRYQAMFGDSLTPLFTGDDGTIEFPGIRGPQLPLMIDVRQAVVEQQHSRDKSKLSFGQKLERRVVGRYITLKASNVAWHDEKSKLQNTPPQS